MHNASIALGVGLACNMGLTAVLWIFCVWRKDASLVDRYWSLLFAMPATIDAALFVEHQAAAPMRWLVVLVGIGSWALRLAVHITYRSWGHGEDRRYQAIRARHQPYYAVKSLFLIFWLQAVLAWLLAVPIAAALTGPRGWGVIDGLGVLVCVAGLLLETIADAQLLRFRANPDNAARVMNQGVWRYSRHPNYFGEACFWWGVWLWAVGAWGIHAMPLILAPTLMTYLLRRVSGVTLLEQDIGHRRPAYREYIHNTPAFMPGRPKDRSPQ